MPSPGAIKKAKAAKKAATEVPVVAPPPKPKDHELADRKRLDELRREKLKRRRAAKSPAPAPVPLPAPLPPTPPPATE